MAVTTQQVIDEMKNIERQARVAYEDVKKHGVNGNRSAAALQSYGESLDTLVEHGASTWVFGSASRSDMMESLHKAIVAARNGKAAGKKGVDSGGFPWENSQTNLTTYMTDMTA